MRSWSNRSLDQSFVLPYIQRRMPGFTMLEVCVVLFIIAVLFVVTVPVASHLLDEEKLQAPIRELQAFARTARRDAMMEDHSYEVLLLNDSYVLRPVDGVKDTEKKPMNLRTPLRCDVRNQTVRRPRVQKASRGPLDLFSQRSL